MQRPHSGAPSLSAEKTPLVPLPSFPKFLELLTTFFSENAHLGGDSTNEWRVEASEVEGLAKFLYASLERDPGPPTSSRRRLSIAREVVAASAPPVGGATRGESPASTASGGTASGKGIALWTPFTCNGQALPLRSRDWSRRGEVLCGLVLEGCVHATLPEFGVEAYTKVGPGAFVGNLWMDGRGHGGSPEGREAEEANEEEAGEGRDCVGGGMLPPARSVASVSVYPRSNGLLLLISMTEVASFLRSSSEAGKHVLGLKWMRALTAARGEQFRSIATLARTLWATRQGLLEKEVGRTQQIAEEGEQKSTANAVSARRRAILQLNLEHLNVKAAQEERDAAYHAEHAEHDRRQRAVAQIQTMVRWNKVKAEAFRLGSARMKEMKAEVVQLDTTINLLRGELEDRGARLREEGAQRRQAQLDALSTLQALGDSRIKESMRMRSMLLAKDVRFASAQMIAARSRGRAQEELRQGSQQTAFLMNKLVAVEEDHATRHAAAQARIQQLEKERTAVDDLLQRTQTRAERAEECEQSLRTRLDKAERERKLGWAREKEYRVAIMVLYLGTLHQKAECFGATLELAQVRNQCRELQAEVDELNVYEEGSGERLAEAADAARCAQQEEDRQVLLAHILRGQNHAAKTVLEPASAAGEGEDVSGLCKTLYNLSVQKDRTVAELTRREEHMRGQVEALGDQLATARRAEVEQGRLIRAQDGELSLVTRAAKALQQRCAELEGSFGALARPRSSTPAEWKSVDMLQPESARRALETPLVARHGVRFGKSHYQGGRQPLDPATPAAGPPFSRQSRPMSAPMAVTEKVPGPLRPESAAPVGPPYMGTALKTKMWSSPLTKRMARQQRVQWKLQERREQQLLHRQRPAPAESEENDGAGFVLAGSRRTREGPTGVDDPEVGGEAEGWSTDALGQDRAVLSLTPTGGHVQGKNIHQASMSKRESVRLTHPHLQQPLGSPRKARSPSPSRGGSSPTRGGSSPTRGGQTSSMLGRTRGERRRRGGSKSPTRRQAGTTRARGQTRNLQTHQAPAGGATRGGHTLRNQQTAGRGAKSRLCPEHDDIGPFSSW